MMNIQFNIPEVNLIINLSIIFKLLLTTVIGLIIGKERKRNEKPGGSRTFSLVCLGSTLVAILSLQLVNAYNFDFTRLMAYGIAGISFLGSGIIIQNKNHVLGLTSASTLWTLVIIGYFIGLGYYTIGIFSSILVYAILESKYKLKKRRGVNKNGGRKI